MDLSIPFLDDEQKEYIEWVIDQDLPEFHPKLFIQIYNEDKLGGMIRNLDIWLDNNFTQFKGYKN